MKESGSGKNTLFKQLKKAFDAYQDGFGENYDLQRHEDAYSVGIPDVSYGINGVNGWIELKTTKHWPKQFKTELSSEQSCWLSIRGITGGNCFVFHWVSDVYMLYDYTKIYNFEGNTKTYIYENCLWMCHKQDLNAHLCSLVNILICKNK